MLGHARHLGIDQVKEDVIALLGPVLDTGEPRLGKLP